MFRIDRAMLPLPVWSYRVGVVLADALVVIESVLFVLFGTNAFFNPDGTPSSSTSPSSMAPAVVAFTIYLVILAACAAAFAIGTITNNERIVRANCELLTTTAHLLYVCSVALFITSDVQIGVAAVLCGMLSSMGASACRTLALLIQGLRELSATSPPQPQPRLYQKLDI